MLVVRIPHGASPEEIAAKVAEASERLSAAVSKALADTVPDAYEQAITRQVLNGRQANELPSYDARVANLNECIGRLITLCEDKCAEGAKERITRGIDEVEKAVAAVAAQIEKEGEPGGASVH